MWLCCVVLVIGAMQAQAAKRQQVLTEAFQEGQSPEVLDQQNDQSQITISGTGTISQNGKTSLNINVEIDGNAGLGNLGRVPPGAKGSRNPGGRFPRPGGRFPKPGGRFPRPGGRFPRPGGQPGRFPGTPAGGVPGGAPPSGAPSGGAPPGGAPPGGAPPGGAPPSPPGGPPGEFTTEEEIGLSTHNEFRQIHQVPLMTLDRTMCDEAKAYAEKIAKMGKLEHSSRDDRHRQGENLSYGCSSNAPQTVEEAVTNWYNEVCDPGYDFASGGFSGGTGHFTQVVWKESTVLGIGRFEIEEETVTADGTKFKMQCAYIVGRYKPAGNMMSKFQENVPKGNFKPGEYCSSVSSNRRKYFDENGKAVFISTPFTEVDFPEVINGTSQDTPPPAIELLNSKKKKAFVGSKQH